MFFPPNQYGLHCFMFLKPTVLCCFVLNYLICLNVWFFTNVNWISINYLKLDFYFDQEKTIRVQWMLFDTDDFKNVLCKIRQIKCFICNKYYGINIILSKISSFSSSLDLQS